MYEAEVPWGTEDGTGVIEGTDATSEILEELNTDDFVKHEYICFWAEGIPTKKAFKLQMED